MAQPIAESLAAQPAPTIRPGARLQGFIAGWAALGVTLSGATQLRMEGLPAGPSEVILAAWLAFVGFLLLRGVRFAPSRVFVVMTGYWLAQLAILGLGAAMAVHARRFDSADAIHDSVAFFYIGTLTVFLSLRLLDRDGYNYHWTFARLIFVFHAVAAGLLLAVALVTPAVGPIRFWYGGVRFAGWAENPNQIALLVTAMPFLGWWLMRGPSGWFAKAAYLVGIMLCIAAGVATKSDGLRVGWLAGLGAVFAVHLYRVSIRGQSKWLAVSHFLLPALVVVIGLSFGKELTTYVYDVAEGVYAEGDQGEKRFILWLHGLQAIRESPLFGFGPGPFSGYTGPFEGREAHNSFIDWAMSTGAVGLALYLCLLAWCLQCALRSGEAMPLAMLISIVLDSFFGYVLRQPDFWVVVLLVLILSEHAIAIRKPQASQPVFEQGGGASWPRARPASRFEQNRFQ